MKYLHSTFLVLFVAALLPASAAEAHELEAVFCADGTGELCSRLPGYIGSAPVQAPNPACRGIVGALPNTAKMDSPTPFGSMAWQMFVEFNWEIGPVGKGSAARLTTPGARVWQTY